MWAGFFQLVPVTDCYSVPSSNCSRPTAGRDVASPSKGSLKRLEMKTTRRSASFSLGLLFCQIPVEGPVPEGRHSHSACGWEGGVLIAGGLGAAEQPLGSVFFLRELDRGFQWQAVGTHPPLIPR